MGGARDRPERAAVEAAKRRARGGISKPRMKLKSMNGMGARASLHKSSLLEVFQQRAGVLPPVLEETAAGDHESQDKENLVENARLVPAKSFFFQQRHGKIDLRAVARVDLERVVADVDIDTLQGLLENLTFAELDDRDLRAYTDADFSKLFRLTQLTIEYLLNVQHTLYAYSSTVESQLVEVKKESDRAAKAIESQSGELQGLKRELKQKRRTLKTYEFLLTQRRQPSGHSDEGSEQAAVPSLDARTVRHHEQQRRQLEEQTETMRRLLKEEMESARASLVSEIEEQRAAFAGRERSLREQEDTLKAQIAAAEQRLNGLDKEQQKEQLQRRVSLAGNVLEDDDAQVQHEIDRILGNSGSVGELRNELSTMLQENQRLRADLAEGNRIGNLAQREPPRKAGDSQLPSPEVSEPSPPNSTAAATVPTTQKHDESLMLRLSGAKVSRDLADARSLQLRRVLRLTRRNLQRFAFGQWRSLAQELQARLREKRLMEQMEALRRRVEANDDGEGASFQLRPSYEWQQVSEQMHLPLGIEERTGGNGEREVRIPNVWVLSVPSSLGTTFSVPVAKNMTIEQVSNALAKEAGKHSSVLELLQAPGAARLDDLATVRSADLFNATPYLHFSATTGKSGAAIDKIVQSFKEQENFDLRAGSAPRGDFSPMPDKPHIKAQWFHSEEEVAATKLEIEQELARSIGSDASGSASRYQALPSPSLTPRTSPAPSPGSLSSAAAASLASSRGLTPGVTPKDESVPVNFGDDYESSFDRTGDTQHSREKSRTPLSAASSGGSFLGDSAPSSDLPANLHISSTKSPYSRETIMRRHKQTMSRFTKVGLIRRAQINTLNLSDDSGSSRTATSLSSAAQGKSTGGALSRTGTSSTSDIGSATTKSLRSHFDVAQRADRYEQELGGTFESRQSSALPLQSPYDPNSDNDGSSLLEYTESTFGGRTPRDDAAQQRQAISHLLDTMEDDDDSDA